LGISTYASVLLEHGVEDRVADLVADLVGVSFGDGLGREQAQGHAGDSSIKDETSDDQRRNERAAGSGWIGPGV